uniref:C2H2-type domain-containing protein n=2 Tax=Bionectria ochroleuca TaxID=29856 RepID=A0A0B7JTX5_BIOOC
MDLTPPSLTTSPYSPQRKHLDSPPYIHPSCCMPETTAGGYPSTTAVDSHPYNIPPPYGSMIDPSLDPHVVNGGSPLAPLGSMTGGVSWNHSSVSAAASPADTTTSSIMPTGISSEYEQFTAYDSSCLPQTYPQSNAYGRPASQSPAFLRTPPSSSSDMVVRDRSSLSSTSSYVFAREQAMASKSKVNSALSYGGIVTTPQYDASTQLPSRTSFNTNPPMYLGEGFQTPHSTHLQPPHSGLPQGQLPLSAPATTIGGPSSASQILVNSTDRGQTWTRLRRKKRPTRKHTTKEEANYQCTIDGCGKFFSRSYNFKSHLETHDDKREYPFPCKEPNCTKKFVRKTDLQRHHQSVHTKERNHKCDFCGRMFARKDTLRRHMEDGCSKRFEIGMLDAEEYEEIESAKLPEVPRPRELQNMGTTLRPPMSANPITTGPDDNRGLAMPSHTLTSRVDNWR